MARYLVGIDLGTTNSALAFIDTQQARGNVAPRIQAFPVPQLVLAGETQPRELLPSFLYLPGEHDLPAGSIALPWNPGATWAVGEFARNHGAKVPGRLVASAKSWLCHAGVDRSAPLLPWSAPPDVPRISPVEASMRFLKHLVDSWNHVKAANKPELRLEKQMVVLTVPASFDDMARTLTVEAAKKAGLENVTLLEEPQAAFYCWLATHPPQEASKLHAGDSCLVVDVGGGTTDFSLIQADEEMGHLAFLRQAVGDHLLLGGDNMDLALAKHVEAKLPSAGKLDAAQYGMLTQACRQGKESLLGDQPPANFRVAMTGRGRSVIGGTLHATLTLDDVKQIVLDGFFPLVPRGTEPQRGARTGLHEMGLPYVSDPAVTRHLASFLAKHLGAAKAPQAILFNGGVFTAPTLRDRIVEALHQWFDADLPGWQPLVLTNPSLDLAVAFGATQFAWLKHTGGKRIGGGMARSYYVAVHTREGGDPSKITALCVVPQHLEEGQEIALTEPELELALGQPVMFPLFSSTVRGMDKPGEVLELAPKQLAQLPPLHTVLRGGKRSGGAKSVPVTLAARCTEIGTLELFCVAKDGNNRWRLEFNVRDIVHDNEGDDDKPTKTVADVWPEELVQQAAKHIRGTYRNEPDAVPATQLTKALEVALESSRDKWPTALCRRMWDFLSEVSEFRKQSPAHLSRWYNLVGFCLRPGFGDPMDRFRVDQLWKMVNAPPKSAKTNLTQPEGGADHWIMWRRVAGGLNTALQNQLASRLRPVLLGKASKPGANELTEMWRAAASLERIDVKQKELLGQAALKLCRRSPTPVHGFFALTRLGARVLLYGPLNGVVHPQVVQQWIDEILAFEPGHDSERIAWAFCLAQLARCSGQRAIDIDDSHRRSVLTVLRGTSTPPHWTRMVEEVVELDSSEQDQMFGEALPIGLRLARSEE